jgi:putative membrane protein
MKNQLRVLLLVLGLALFGWFIYQAGLEAIWEMITRLGWLAPILLLPYSAVYLADTWGWHFAFGRPGRHGLPIRTVLRIRWAGESVNNVVPSAYIGGEAVKVYLLHKRNVSPRNATSSVVVGRTAQTFSQLIFVALGALAFLQFVPPGSGFRKGMIVVLAGCVCVVGLLFWLQSRGLFAIALGLLDRLRVHWAVLHDNRSKLHRIDRQVRRFYRYERGHFFLSAACYLGGWTLDALESWLTGWLLDIPVTFSHAIGIEAFLGVAKVMGLFVPGALGVQESGIVFLCRAAGLPDVFGISYALLRRGREVGGERDETAGEEAERKPG